PLHPVLDWVSDRALSNLGRDQVFAVRGDGEDLAVVLQGTLTNQRGQVVSASFLTATFLNPDNPAFAATQAHGSATAALRATGFTEHSVNTGSLTDTTGLQRFLGPAVDS